VRKLCEEKFSVTGINEAHPIFENVKNLERAYMEKVALMEMRINKIIFQLGGCDFRVCTEIHLVRRNNTFVMKVQALKICTSEVSVGFRSMHVKSMKQSPIFWYRTYSTEIRC
jgi:hypothetical protein